MGKVWVVMSNDYPDAVFDSEAAAAAYVAAKEAVAAERPRGLRVRWRSYEFALNKHSSFGG